jgi:hypothetical protein
MVQELRRKTGNRQDQRDGVVAGLAAAEAQRSLLDGLGDPRRGHAFQAGDEITEAVVAAEAAAGMVAGLGDAVGEQDQAVTSSQQHAAVMQLGMGQEPEQGSRLPGRLHAPVAAAHQRQRVPPRADPHRGSGGSRPDGGINRGQEPRVIGQPVQQGLVQGRQDDGRPGLPMCLRPQGVAGQRGALGRRDALAAHVTDHHSPAPPTEGKTS